MTTKQKFYNYIEELCAYAIADCEVNDKKADEFWGWFKLKMEEAYKGGREDEAIECQKDMERVVEEMKRDIKKPFSQKEFVRLANEVGNILAEEKRTMTGAYDVTTRAGKKRFRDMLRELAE